MGTELSVLGTHPAGSQKEATLKNETATKTFDSFPDAYFMVDLDSNIVECKQSWCELLGFSSKEELVGKSVLPLLAERDRERVLDDVEEILERGFLSNRRWYSILCYHFKRI